MRPIPLARLLLLALSVALCLASCSTTGKAPPSHPPQQVVQTQLVEVPRQQLVRLDPRLLEAPALAPAPAPAVPPGPDCNRPAGCYSEPQLAAMLDAALDWGSRAVDNLRAIGHAIDAAITPTQPEHPR